MKAASTRTIMPDVHTFKPEAKVKRVWIAKASKESEPFPICGFHLQLAASQRGLAAARRRFDHQAICQLGKTLWHRIGDPSGVVENASAWSCGGDGGPGQSHAPPLLQTSGFTPGAGWTCTKEILRGWTLVFPDTPSPPHQPTQWTFHGITKHCRIVLRISWCVFSFSSFKSEGDWDKRMGVVGAVVVAGLVNVLAAEVFWGI